MFCRVAKKNDEKRCGKNCKQWKPETEKIRNGKSRKREVRSEKPREGSQVKVLHKMEKNYPTVRCEWEKGKEEGRKGKVVCLSKRKHVHTSARWEKEARKIYIYIYAGRAGQGRVLLLLRDTH